jgi:5-methyltetrahydrofolate--homocysteine methyltransferase
LAYRRESEAAFDRLTAWWKGEGIGRPAMQILVPRKEPIEAVEVLPEPEGWSTHYSTRSMAYRANLAARACIYTDFWGEAIPNVSPDLGPNCLALYLGCQAREGQETVWFEPCIQAPETARFEFQPENFYWRFTLELARKQLAIGRGKFLTSFPDLIEGLDTLAAMRGTQELLLDLLERPEWIQSSLEKITRLYFEYYELLFDLVRDDRGGSHFWAWAPGRVAKLQCDMSSMISPSMFEQFMVPVLRAMTARLDYTIYHLDGPGALTHHDLLVAIPGIDVIQWTPGAAAEPVWDRRWWPLYHRTIEAGKKLMLLDLDAQELQTLRKEFGKTLGHFLLRTTVPSPREAEAALRVVEI